MVRIYTTALLTFIVVTLFSQERPNFQNFEGEITGKVIDQPSNKVMPYANISVFRVKDSTLVDGTITDDKGFFKITKLHPGFYKVKIDYIGYERYTILVKVTPQNPNINLGNILLKPAITTLNEVEVTGERNVMEFKLDKKVINVDKDIATSGANATDILRNTPSIQVDMDGNVSLRGSTNVNILVDGKPSTLSAGDKAAILEQIPASTIERIEIITNPSAKYDPEGMAGIINIVTKHEKREGINGLISLNYGTFQKYSGSVNINKRMNKTNVFFNYDYRNDLRKGYRNHDRYFYVNDSLISHTLINSDNQHKIYSHNFKTGFDYFINPTNNITFSTTYRLANRTVNNYSINKVIQQSNYNSYYKRTETSKEPSQSIDVNLGYRKRFQEPIREFSTDIYFSSLWEDETEDFSQTNFFPIHFSPNQRSTNKNHFINTTIQSDYVHPINETTRLDAGIKAMNRITDNNYNFYQYDTISDAFQNNQSMSNHFVYSDYVYAAYIILSKEWKKFSTQIGIRPEQTFQHGEQKTTNSVFNRNYFSLFPSTHISYNLPNQNKFQISYSRRINRPFPQSLNPFVDKSDPLTYRSGNPNLKPEFINSYELGHIKDWKKISLTSQLFYKTTNNVVSRYRKVDTTGIVTIYPINMNKAESYGIEFIVSSQPIKILRMSGTFSYFNTKVTGSDGENDLTNSINSYDAKFNVQLMLPKEFSLQINGMFNGPSVMAQATREAFYTIDAGLRKNFWNRKAYLTVRMSDIFNTMRFKVKTDDPSLKAIMDFKRETRILYVTFTYNINEGIKQRERQRQQQLENMDNMDFGE